ncbi:MAG: carboxymuconolactone decarboxylase family protein [Gammaproteobacteria bacterium]
MRILVKPHKKYPWYLLPFFWNQRRKYGQILNPGLVWGRVPRLFLGVATLYGAFDNRFSTLTPVLRSLISVRVSQLQSCHFCVDLNSCTLARRCGSMEKVLQLQEWRESPLFDEVERAVLDYAETVSYHDRQVTEEQVALLRKYFDEEGLVELTGLIAFQNMSSMFNTALDIAPQGFCLVPPDRSE